MNSGIAISNGGQLIIQFFPIISISASTGLVKMNLEKALPSMEEGNNDHAAILLNEGHRQISTVCGEVKYIMKLE